MFGDLAIRSCPPCVCDAQLSRCQGVAAADPIATRPRARYPRAPVTRCARRHSVGQGQAPPSGAHGLPRGAGPAAAPSLNHTSLGRVPGGQARPRAPSPTCGRRAAVARRSLRRHGLERNADRTWRAQPRARSTASSRASSRSCGQRDRRRRSPGLEPERHEPAARGVRRQDQPFCIKSISRRPWPRPDGAEETAASHKAGSSGWRELFPATSRSSASRSTCTWISTVRGPVPLPGARERLGSL